MGLVSGTPVSQGSCEGWRTVVRTLQEAANSNLRNFDLPVHRCGMDPLFSLAAGLVTEIGGL